ncbi:hypothetical protein M426DRAFT_320498 [Hypoxylon sp. CI-4A]|nr:hypothetical protein M426DRAFT_320498 [Hypoxylon sp. CI-4A]
MAVQWPWITVVCTEVILTTVLLAIVIARKEPVFKASIMAFLVHGLHGWDQVDIPQIETNDTLKVLSKKMVARLEDSDGAGVRFVKQG